MNRRGFSLIELLIVLGVMVALGAVAAVELGGASDEARLDAAIRRTRTAFALARAEAQRAGGPLALVARAGRHGTRLEIEPFDPAADDRASNAAGGETGGAARTNGAPRRPRVIAELPERVTVSDRPPEPAAMLVSTPRVEGAAVAPTTPASPARPSATPEGLRLAVMLPDGTCWVSGPRYVIGPGSRVARITASRWTGLAHAERIEITGEVPEPGEPPPERPETDAGGRTGG
ncbi:MAG: Tfp pilus assembly protein FimT/FimU [Phycisphaerales bacterium]